MSKQPVRREQSVVTQIRPAPPDLKPVPFAVPQKKSSPALGLLLLVGAVGLAWFAWKSGGTPENAGHRDMSHIDDVVNKHLIMTNKLIELQQERARLENHDSVPEVGDQILPRWRPQHVDGVDHSPDRNEANATRDLEQPKDLNLVSPDTIIQSEMADAEKRHEYEQKYKEEYTRRFIENARAGGYDIEVDDNFVVKKVRKIHQDDPNAGLFGH